MKRTTLAAALVVGGCAVTPADAPDFRREYQVAYQALAECVYSNISPSLGTRYEPLPTLGEVRISEHQGLETGRIISFKATPSGGAAVEFRAAVNAQGQLSWFLPVIETCAKGLTESGTAQGRM